MLFCLKGKKKLLIDINPSLPLIASESSKDGFWSTQERKEGHQKLSPAGCQGVSLLPVENRTRRIFSSSSVRGRDQVTTLALPLMSQTKKNPKATGVCWSLVTKEMMLQTLTGLRGTCCVTELSQDLSQDPASRVH